jgi:acetylornithine deacetylase/succinyl-diaminopimelate desuccinylase-like protein
VLYALGVADVKLDALCKAEAVRRLQGRRARRPYWLLGTFGEEVGLRGARHFAESDLFREVAPAQVLCGEPSELRIISAHKGYAVVRCRLRDRKARPVNTEGPGVEQLQFAGKAAHSSTPHLGENAILKALSWVKSSGSAVVTARGGSGTNVVPASCVLEVPAPREKGDPQPADTKFLPPRAPQPNLWRALATASALEELWQRLLPAGSDARFDPPGAVGGLNVLESAEGGISIDLDARLLPDQDPEAVIAAFRAQADAWVRELGQGDLELAISVERSASGMSLPPDALLVKTVGAVLARHGLDATPRAKPTSTEAGVFARAGCEAIVFGPGRSTGNAHTPNERIDVAQLEQACDLYEAIVSELCACT